MTTIARICERWTMQLEDPTPGDEWFLDWVLRSPKQAGRHLTAGWLALRSLLDVYAPTDIRSCREYFGGMGAQALMVEDLFWTGDKHHVMEFSREGVKHLERVLPPSVNPFWGDAYDPIYHKHRPADLVMLDFGDLTAWKTREGERHRQLLDAVFDTKPKAVVLTDIACRYLHLHRARYSELLGLECANYEVYLCGLLQRLRSLYGYTLVRGYMDRWSTVMALVPDHPNLPMELIETPAHPVGLDLI